MKVNSAGFILFKVFDDKSFKILILRKKNGELDLPKGRKDFGESDLYTAVRETFEETGINIYNNNIIDSNGFQIKNLKFFIAKVDKDTTVFIKRNPKTGQLEHVDSFWETEENTLKIFKKNKSYLFKYLVYALSVIKDYTNKE